MIKLLKGESLSISDARKNLASLTEELASSNKTVQVTRSGEPVLAILSWDLFECIKDTLEILGDDEARAILEKGVQAYKAGNYTRLEDELHLFQ